MKRIIISAADDNYFSLLKGLIKSLYQWEEKPFDAIGILDLGLSDLNRYELSKLVNFIVIPDWPLDIAETLRNKFPYLRGYVSRPFLPKYFPGYDIYLWLDADTWVQNRFAIEWLFDSATDLAIGIIPEVDRNYQQKIEAINWRVNRLSSFFPNDGELLYPVMTYYNSGVFALRADAPHWESWAKYYQIGLKRSLLTYSDQTALNYAIWKDNLDVHPLPALCNWCCHLAKPKINFKTNKFCEPSIPNSEIGILHLSSKGLKNAKFLIESNGISIEYSYRFGGLKNISILIET